MAVTPNVITSQDTIEGIIQEYVSKYQGEYDLFEQTVGLFGVETVNAGTALYKYKVTGQLADTAIDPGTVTYQRTTDAEPVSGKTYYTKGDDGSFSAVGSPAKKNIGSYYVAYGSAGSSSGRAYVEGDLITRTNYRLEKVPLGEVNFIPYAASVTAQAIQRGGLQNAVARVVREMHKQLRSDSVADLFDWLSEFDGTAASPASGKTWNLQQLLAHTDETMFDTLETYRESDTDIVHFVNRSDAYEYLADAAITTQDLFGLTYLENFLGVQKVFLTNKVEKGRVIATPVSNVKVYGIDYGTINSAGLSYQTDDYGLVGFAYDPDLDHAGISIYPVRSMTMLPEKDEFVVKGSSTHVG